MSHVITSQCCTDASCVIVCPVNAIHPTPDEAEFARADMLYIDPVSCIDCGACVDACPIGVIYEGKDLPGEESPAVALNEGFFENWEEPGLPLYVLREREAPSADLHRVAVVGGGPAGHFVADELLRRSSATITLYDLDSQPYGLIRTGVAADHTATRSMRDELARIGAHERVDYRLGVRIGTDITVAQLLTDYDAVVLANGASGDGTLAVPGADLAGVVQARALAAWFNDIRDGDDPVGRAITGVRHVVVVGGGNVALDAARLLLTRNTADSVDVVIRSSAAESAFTPALLAELSQLADIAIEIDGAAAIAPEVPLPTPDRVAKLRLLRQISDAPRADAGKRLRFVFATEVSAIAGADRVESVTITGPAGTEVIAADLVVVAIGARREPIAEMDNAVAQPNTAGPVLDAAGNKIPGLYAAGWAATGPHGGIGHSRVSAMDCVDAILADTTGAEQPEQDREEGEQPLAGTRRSA